MRRDSLGVSCCDRAHGIVDRRIDRHRVLDTRKMKDPVDVRITGDHKPHVLLSACCTLDDFQDEMYAAAIEVGRGREIDHESGGGVGNGRGQLRTELRGVRNVNFAFY